MCSIFKVWDISRSVRAVLAKLHFGAKSYNSCQFKYEKSKGNL